jgi:hypothetical protein
LTAYPHAKVEACGALSLALGLGACTDPNNPGQRAVGGGLIGGAAGAGIGALAGGGKGALIGGLAGSALGRRDGLRHDAAGTRLLASSSCACASAE